MRTGCWLIGGVLAGLLVAACQSVPLRRPAAAQTTLAAPAQPSARGKTGVFLTPEPPVEADRSEVGGLSLTRVQKSDAAIPSWTSVGGGEENGRVFQLGKGSSLRSEFEAQQAGMHEAVGSLIRGLFGDRTKFRTTVEVKAARRALPGAYRGADLV